MSLYFPHIYLFSQRKQGFWVLLTAVFRGNEFHALEVDKTRYYKDNNKLLLHKGELITKNMKTKTNKKQIQKYRI